MQSFDTTGSIDLYDHLETQLESAQRHIRGRWVSLTTSHVGVPVLGDDVIRRALLGWLLALTDRLRLQFRTFERAVQSIDDYMYHRKGSVTTNKLRYLAVACLRNAAKFEELTDNAPTLTQVLEECSELRGDRLTAVEWQVACSTGFTSLGAPTPVEFVAIFIQAYETQCESCRYGESGQKQLMRILAQYYCASALLDTNILRRSDTTDDTGFDAATIGGAALAVSRATMGLPCACAVLYSGDHYPWRPDVNRLTRCANTILLHERHMTSDPITLQVRRLVFRTLVERVGWTGSDLPTPVAPNFLTGRCKPPLTFNLYTMENIDDSDDDMNNNNNSDGEEYIAQCLSHSCPSSLMLVSPLS
jgi:hypothetical protein